MIDLKNYEIKRSDRQNKKGGGVAIYHKNTLNIQELEKPLISDTFVCFEYIAINLITTDSCVTFLCFYIPPDISKCKFTMINVCKVISYFL